MTSAPLPERLRQPGAAVVFVTSPGRGHCRALKPVAESVGSEYQGRVRLVLAGVALLALAFHDRLRAR
jgi:thioredoxin-like negative regulator of GroEL